MILLTGATDTGGGELVAPLASLPDPDLADGTPATDEGVDGQLRLFQSAASGCG
jgi:hypothetical protein